MLSRSRRRASSATGRWSNSLRFASCWPSIKWGADILAALTVVLSLAATEARAQPATSSADRRAAEEMLGQLLLDPGTIHYGRLGEDSTVESRTLAVETKTRPSSTPGVCEYDTFILRGQKPGALAGPKAAAEPLRLTEISVERRYALYDLLPRAALVNHAERERRCLELGAGDRFARFGSSDNDWSLWVAAHFVEELARGAAKGPGKLVGPLATACRAASCPPPEVLGWRNISSAYVSQADSGKKDLRLNATLKSLDGETYWVLTLRGRRSDVGGEKPTLRSVQFTQMSIISFD